VDCENRTIGDSHTRNQCKEVSAGVLKSAVRRDGRHELLVDRVDVRLEAPGRVLVAEEVRALGVVAAAVHKGAEYVDDGAAILRPRKRRRPALASPLCV